MIQYALAYMALHSGLRLSRYEVGSLLGAEAKGSDTVILR